MTCSQCEDFASRLKAERTAKLRLIVEIEDLRRQLRPTRKAARRQITKVRYRRGTWQSTTDPAVRWYGPGRSHFAHRCAEKVLNTGGWVEVYSAPVGPLEEVEVESW